MSNRNRSAPADLDRVRQILNAPIAINSADRSLIELYPRWRTSMAEWDAICGRLEKSDGDSYALRRGLASVAREREALEAEIIAIVGYGPAGAVAKLTVLRTMTRSGETDATKTATAEAIAVLALAHGIEPYDYQSVFHTTKISPPSA